MGRIEYVVGGVVALDVPTGGLAMHPTICSLVTMYKVEKKKYDDDCYLNLSTKKEDRNIDTTKRKELISDF